MDQAKGWWDGEFEDPVFKCGKLNHVFSPKMNALLLAFKFKPSDLCLVQDLEFASLSNSALGLVLREAGPVSPMTSEVVFTKVA